MSSLKLSSRERARAELERRRRQRIRAGLMEFIPWLTPAYEPPWHLRPLIERIERPKEAPFELICHTPPRHAKTETLLHLVAYGLYEDPSLTFGYVTYSATLSRSKSRKARALALAARVKMAADMQNLEEWRTAAGGGLLATGVGGPLTGHGVNVLIVDDPFKNRVDAESARHRDMVWDWFNDVAYTRLEPGGSVIVNMARWHEDDLAGRLRSRMGWEYLCLPAISYGPTPYEPDREEGSALWDARFPVARLQALERQLGPYGFSSLYQGSPRPRGGSLFSGTWFYSVLPEAGWSAAFGVDLAYSSKTSSDFSCVVEMVRAGEKYYVVNVTKAQVKAPAFAQTLFEWRQRRPYAPMKWYAYGPEKGSADLINALKPGVGLSEESAPGDKFQRAQGFMAQWNAGNVLLPEVDPGWVAPFVDELTAFTGTGNDAHDDQVDAAVAAFDCLANTGAGVVVGGDRTHGQVRQY